MRNPLPALALLLALALPAAASVPTWGARASSPVDTAPSTLKPGEWIWGGDSRALGPMAVVVSLTEQRAYVYRNGMLVAVSTVSTGKQGHETPTGVFTILQKDKDHRSNIYNNAPMPYQQRLTWGGIALHAGGLPGYPESHGCVHLPTEFARLLFDASNMGMTVVVAEQGEAPVQLVHPAMAMPIDARTGAGVEIPKLADGEEFRWQPELSPEGPISMLLSRGDQRLVVYRNGVEIGRTRVGLRRPGATTGTHAYIVGKGFMPGDNPDLPGTRMPNWYAIGIPGRGDEADRSLDAETISQVAIPPGFVSLVLPLLQPGTLLVATDAPMTADAGEHQTVIDSDPPGG
jgi:hypothetical protein